MSRKKTGLPKWLTTVTPLSKAVALSLFIILPIIAFFIGLQLGMSIVPDRILYVPTYLEKSCNRALPTPTPLLRPR